MIAFLLKYHVFGFSSLIGLLVAVVGFCITLINVLKTKKAAIRTQEIINKVMKDVSRIDTISELSATLNAMDEIKTKFQRKDFSRLPEGCNQMRTKLIFIREAYKDFTPEQSAVIQGSITFLNRMESEFILIRENNEETINTALFSKNFNKHIDELHVVLINVKKQIGRHENG